MIWPMEGAIFSPGVLKSPPGKWEAPAKLLAILLPGRHLDAEGMQIRLTVGCTDTVAFYKIPMH